MFANTPLLRKKKKEDGKCDAIKSKLVFFVYRGLKKFRLF